MRWALVHLVPLASLVGALSLLMEAHIQSTSAQPTASAATEPHQPAEVAVSEPETARSGPKEYLDAEDGIHRLTDRPTYQQRREAQLANGAQRVSKRVGKQMHKPPKRELRLQWVPCKVATSESGHSLKRFGSQKPTCFPTEADAIEAEQRHATECGYHERVVGCRVCGAFHVAHNYSVDHFASQEKAPPEMRSGRAE